MRRTLRALALAALVAFALPVAMPGLASAQSYREFTGKVGAIDAQKVVVDNRMGDEVTFERLDDTAVAGQEKRAWRDLKKNDWVTVHWKMTDKPRKAYRVDVLPPKDEGG